MSLVNPYLAYGTVRDAIVALLKANKTILNTGLTTGSTFTSDNQIMAGNIFLTPTPNDLYPVIMVKVINKKEDWESLGAAGRKRPIITFRIYGIIRIVGGTVDTEIMTLTKNIEAVLRDNITISGAVIFSQPTFTDFGVGEFSKGVYVEVVAIDLECMMEII
jgi:hypothetical protein